MSVDAHTYLFLIVRHHFGSFFNFLLVALWLYVRDRLCWKWKSENGSGFTLDLFSQNTLVWGSFAFSCSAVVMEISPWRLEWIEDVMREDTMTVPYRPSWSLTEEPVYFCSNPGSLEKRVCGGISTKYYVASCSFCDTFKVKCPLNVSKNTCINTRCLIWINY